MRVQFDRGWVSERTASGKALLQLLSDNDPRSRGSSAEAKCAKDNVDKLAKKSKSRRGSVSGRFRGASVVEDEKKAMQQLIDLELATDTEAAKAAAAAEEEAIQKEMEQIMQEEAAAR